MIHWSALYHEAALWNTPLPVPQVIFFLQTYPKPALLPPLCQLLYAEVPARTMARILEGEQEMPEGVRPGLAPACTLCPRRCSNPRVLGGTLAPGSPGPGPGIVNVCGV